MISDCISEMKQTWIKIENTSKQIGLREGISDGRDSNFQNNFDKGYGVGFKNGYLLGKLKGFFLYKKNHQEDVNLDLLNSPTLEKMARGDCVICQQPSLIEKEIKELENHQEIIYSKNQEIFKHFTGLNDKT